ncbi:hypothetical protein SteCoe_36401 [Stentor coeruleus]|uniref:Uncharacterized protein n=1 Tax=Stentor coeruleus TaxID=5963 RepID=A0A1R2AQK1_9CILI|nr:hypothetical protein SteCoe_36401 [Stentor coeruleus]
MCSGNPMCAANDGACNCHLIKSFSMAPRAFSSGFFLQNDVALMNGMLRMMMQQTELIKNTFEVTKKVLDKLGGSSQEPSIPENITGPSDQEIISAGVLTSHLCGGRTDQPYSLLMSEDFPYPIYKERCFSVSLKIVDSSNNPVTLDKPMVFKILLYATENPPKLLTTNTFGDRIMRGTLEIESSSEIIFKKLVIKEVTSRFRNGVVYFVVMPQDTQLVKPMIIEDVLVKARKNAPEMPMKKVKRNIGDEYFEDDSGDKGLDGADDNTR